MLYYLSKLNPKDKNNSNGPIVSNDIKAVIKSLPCNKGKKKKKKPRTRWIHYSLLKSINPSRKTSSQFFLYCFIKQNKKDRKTTQRHYKKEKHRPVL